ncbi:MAG TPA: hypothetical protein VJ140_01190 [Actinomycetota bacterium]|nr:hypothetical protein [Actinomycetota bacterium]
MPADSLIVRDSSNQLFVRDATDGKGYYRGTDLRAHPTWSRVENAHPPGGVHKPLLVKSGGTLFFCSLGNEDDTYTKRIQVTVHDLATGVVQARPTFISADDIICYGAAPDSGGNVWLAWVESSAPTVIQTRKLSSVGAVVTTNSITVASTNFVDLKLRLMPNSELFLVAISVATGGGDIKRYHAYLNTSTGAAKASPAAVTATVTGGPGAATITGGPGLSIADSADAPTAYYYHFWYAFDGTTMRCHRVEVDPTALTASSTATVRTVTVPAGGTGVFHWGGTAAYVATGGTVWLFSSLTEGDTSAGAYGSRVATVVRTVSGVDTTVGRSAYLAGDDVFKVGSSRFILTGFDDSVEDDEPGIQKGYFVRDTDGKLVTSILDGQAGQFAFNGAIGPTGALYDQVWRVSSGHTVGPVVSGTKVYIPLLASGSAKSLYEPTLATVDFAPVWDSRAPGVVPGGVPKSVSKEDPVTELTPIHSPYVALSITGNGSEPTNNSKNWAVFRYTTLNAKGERVPSAPSTTQELTFVNHDPVVSVYTVRVPTLRHAVGPTWIELYLSDNHEVPADSDGDECYLAKRVPNDPTVDYVDVDLSPGQHRAGSGELLETTNLEERLENGPVPPARLDCIWRDRMWLGGTPEDDLPYSQEKRPGYGYEFNEALSVVWQDGTGPVTAICPLSFDALVVWRRDAIGLVTGPGPDPAGNGNYVVQTISYGKGTTNPKSVVQGPAGAYFFNTSDNRPHVVTTAGAIVEISQGFESYLAQVPTASVHDVALGVVRWYCSSGKQLKLDYRRPVPGQEAGQWSEDSNSNLPAAVGAVVLAGAAVMVEAGTSLIARSWQVGTGFTDNGTAVLKDLTTGRLTPAGLLGEFDLNELTISSTRLGGDSAYTYTLTNDQGSTEPHTDAASTTQDVTFWSAINRTREFRLRIQETSATGEGRSFDGIGAVIRPYGKFENPRRRAA